MIMIVFRALDRYQVQEQKMIIDKYQIYKADDGRQLHELSMGELLILFKRRYVSD